MIVRLPKRYPGVTFPAELGRPGDPQSSHAMPVLHVTVQSGRTVTIDPPGGSDCELAEATAVEREALGSAGYALQDDNDIADACYDRGCALLASGRLEESVAAFTRAIELNPADAGAYFNRGYAHARLLQQAGWQRIEAATGTASFSGDERAVDAAGRAIADFTRAFKLDPGKVAALGMRAEVYWVTGQRDLAEADTRAAAALGDRAAAASLRTRFGATEGAGDHMREAQP